MFAQENMTWNYLVTGWCNIRANQIPVYKSYPCYNVTSKQKGAGLGMLGVFPNQILSLNGNFTNLCNIGANRKQEFVCFFVFLKEVLIIELLPWYFHHLKIINK